MDDYQHRRVSAASIWPVMAFTLAIAGGLAAWMAPLTAHAQDSTPPRHAAPARINWQLTVLVDGQETDTMSAVTAVGQSKTITHSRSVSHTVGCDAGHTAPTALSRTLTVSPLGVDDKGVIGLEVSTDETIEDPQAGTTRSDGCTLPPQPRTVSARHPELDVQSGRSVTWTLIPKDPTLAYKVEASVVP